ncbi:protein crumbs homolog 3 isoform X1 [Hylobates moloch]|uniref:protein crumbs homolog 3 isoform X1 n=2 Tax=Hylobates moloch TaxID=81572 RepID=UPI0013646900|nr:protein crumbs homolog 3 isoform X1 [Hylobates moloch]
MGALAPVVSPVGLRPGPDPDPNARASPSPVPRCPVAGAPGRRCGRRGAREKPLPRRCQPATQPMANPGLGLLLALGLPFLLARWGRAWGQILTTSANENSTILPSSTSSSSDGNLSQQAVTAIIVVFSILAALLLAVGLALLVRKLREKRQTEGTYRPSSEEQFSHAAEARAPQDSKETVRGCLPI